jgi:hypothetical protein
LVRSTFSALIENVVVVFCYLKDKTTKQKYERQQQRKIIFYENTLMIISITIAYIDRKMQWF